ncbi:hypothetical protein ALC53_12806 [Atta colombica]|uniref:RRM domain-containing protein n=1 Tax=Atta colombica TaxID=520822 RepID=A0A151HZ67_9HYME|nr:hypothetical protein ALC53_12806 [Atta colombica]
MHKKGKKRSLSETSVSKVKLNKKQENVNEFNKSPKRAKIGSKQNGNPTLMGRTQIFKVVDKQKKEQNKIIEQQNNIVKSETKKDTKETAKLMIVKPKNETIGKSSSRPRKRYPYRTITLTAEQITKKITEIKGREVLSKRAHRVLGKLNRKLREIINESEKLDTVGKKNKKIEHYANALMKNKQKKKGEVNKKRYVLFVGNLPLNITEDEIKRHFLTKVGTIISIRIPTKSNKTPRGFAYVEMTNNIDFESIFFLFYTQYRLYILAHKYQLLCSEVGKNISISTLLSTGGWRRDASKARVKILEQELSIVLVFYQGRLKISEAKYQDREVVSSRSEYVTLVLAAEIEQARLLELIILLNQRLDKERNEADAFAVIRIDVAASAITPSGQVEGLSGNKESYDLLYATPVSFGIIRINMANENTKWEQWSIGSYDAFRSRKYVQYGWWIGIKKNERVKPGSKTFWGQEAIQFSAIQED